MNPYQAKYFAYELSKKATADSPEKFGATLMDAKVELNPHQVEAALFAFKSPYSKGAILADEVGLGKTIEAGILLSQKWAENKRRILIICPSSLRKQWMNELEDKFYLKSEVLDTPSFNKKIKNNIHNPFDSTDTIKVCSYQFARRKAEEIQLTSWDLVVIDEAHYLRNVYRPGNVTAREIARAIRDYKKILLTATPLQNRLDELYGLVSVIDPKMFGDIQSFREKYVRNGNMDTIKELKDRLSDVVHRTLRKDVKEFINFKERIPITQQFTPTEQEQELYDKVLNYLRQESIYAFPTAQKHLLQSVIFKLLGSSTFAIGRTMDALIRRLNTTLDESKVMDDELYDLLVAEYENLDDELDEMDEEEEEINEISLDDKIAIEKEIRQLEQFLLLANSIEHNAKKEQLLLTLKTGFNRLKELGAQQKALIFTESTRTQQYLFDRLSKEKYAGRIVLFNGSNTDPASKEIYESWKKDEKNFGKITGSRAVDIRHALVDAFKSDDYDLMIATEAAAEGVNLQFCSMVVNYDLPWNPQRIEQRIGRVHRYGQEFDVVVVNFLNASNAVEARVFELLNQKFKLFEGVFGSSDEVLGSIESGVDFENRILEAYKQCRTREEIDSYFEALQLEFEDAIDQRVKEVQSKLFENFEASVIEKLRITLSETQVFIEKYEKWLWELTRYYLRNKASFIYDDYTFLLENGEKYTLNKKREDAKAFLLQGEVAQRIIELGKKELTPFAKLKFDFSSSGTIYETISNLKSTSGLLKLSNLEVSSEIENHSVLLFSAITESNETLDDDQCRFLLALPMHVEKVNMQTMTKLENRHEEVKKQRIEHLEKTDAALMQREFNKFNNWADDRLMDLETNIKDARKEVRELRRESIANNLSASEVVEIQEKINKAEKKMKRLRRELFAKEDEIETERDQMIEEAKQQLDRVIREEEIFTVAFEII